MSRKPLASEHSTHFVIIGPPRTSLHRLIHAIATKQRENAPPCSRHVAAQIGQIEGGADIAQALGQPFVILERRVHQGVSLQAFWCASSKTWTSPYS